MKYLLDTNICIYIAKRRPESVLARLKQLRPGDIGMSVVTYMELIYGACKSQQQQANLDKIQQLREIIPVQPLNEASAEHYGRIRTELEKQGSPIGAYDLLIAAQAMSLGLTLVTNNVREFARIRGLRLNNWAR